MTDRLSWPRAIGLALFALAFSTWSNPACQAQVPAVALRLPVDNLGPPADLAWIPRGLNRLPATPPDNPLTAQKVQLGRRLFFDPVLSRDQAVACATCHDPEHGFAIAEPLATGVGGARGTRNAPSLLNRAYDAHLFHDGRASSLEQQALGPLVSETELGGDVEGALSRLRASAAYRDWFTAAFPDERIGSEDAAPVTVQNITRAIASFERTLLSGDSAVDRFRAADVAALSDAARTGMWIFESRGGCWRCHSGATFTDGKFHNTGVSHLAGGTDLGRETVSGNPADRHAFKTPGLRDVSRTAPFMHNGSLATLEDVVAFYARGGAPDATGLDPLLKPVELSATEQAAIVEFLRALDGNDTRVPRGQH